jgi:hypothetical protein
MKDDGTERRHEIETGLVMLDLHKVLHHLHRTNRLSTALLWGVPIIALASFALGLWLGYILWGR